jgi:hypothetical protein
VVFLATWYKTCVATLDPRLVIVSDGQIVGTKEDLNLTVRQSDQLEVELLGQLDGRLADLQLWDRSFNGKIIHLGGSLGDMAAIK